MDTYFPRGLGWHQDLPDHRDIGPHSPVVARMLANVDRACSNQSSVDLREFFPAISDQCTFIASASHACVGLVEYFQRRSFGRGFEPSALFLHRVACRAGQSIGLPGLDLRSHLRALVAFGMPPERYCPDIPEEFRGHAQELERLADPLLYSFREPYRSIVYVKLDARNGTGKETLEQVKAFLAAGFACAFGFSVPSSLTTDANITYRPRFDSVRGGQAAVAVGYDDDRPHVAGGALLLRSSWGSSWGDNGYGWLPYTFVKEQMASCFWTLMKSDWIETGEFNRPAVL